LLGRYRETVDGDGIPEGVDYAEYGRQCEIEGKGKLTELGYVHQRFTMQSIYNNEITERYKIVESATSMEQKPLEKTAIKSIARRPDANRRFKNPSCFNGHQPLKIQTKQRLCNI
jgi:hypothetical protein